MHVYYGVVGISAAKASRPELDKLMRDAKGRKCEAVLVWKLERFGRSVLDLLSRVRKLEGYGVRLDTDSENPMSRFQLNVLSAVAELRGT